MIFFCVGGLRHSVAISPGLTSSGHCRIICTLFLASFHTHRVLDLPFISNHCFIRILRPNWVFNVLFLGTHWPVTKTFHFIGFQIFRVPSATWSYLRKTRSIMKMFFTSTYLYLDMQRLLSVSDRLRKMRYVWIVVVGWVRGFPLHHL